MDNELSSIRAPCADCGLPALCKPYWQPTWYASIYLCDDCALERKESDDQISTPQS